MKKIVMGALMLVLLTACKEAKDNYSYTDKVALTKKIINRNAKAVKEYEEVMEGLSERVEKGDQKAINEFQEWEKAALEASGIEIPIVPGN